MRVVRAIATQAEIAEEITWQNISDVVLEDNQGVPYYLFGSVDIFTGSGCAVTEFEDYMKNTSRVIKGISYAEFRAGTCASKPTTDNFTDAFDNLEISFCVESDGSDGAGDPGDEDNGDNTGHSDSDDNGQDSGRESSSSGTTETAMFSKKRKRTPQKIRRSTESLPRQQKEKQRYFPI